MIHSVESPKDEGALNLDVSGEEIGAIKSQIRRAGSKASVKLVRLTRQPAVAVRLRAIKGTQKLLWISRILGWCSLLLMLLTPFALYFITPWWWTLVLAALLFILINLIQGEINLELGARLLAVNRKMKS